MVVFFVAAGLTMGDSLANSSRPVPARANSAR